MDKKERICDVKRERYNILRLYDKISDEFCLAYCGVMRCEKGYSYGRSRANYHLHIVLSGSGKLTVNKKTYEVHKNQAFLLKAGETSYYQADMDDPWFYCWIGFNGTNAKKYMDEAGFTEGVYVRDCLVDSREYLLLAQRILSISDPMTESVLMRIGIALEFISLAIRSGYSKESAEDLSGAELSYYYVKRAIDFIYGNYARINVSDIANYIGINRGYLTTLFKRETGDSLQEYLLRYRLGKACELLLTTELPIQEIARRVGYDNQMTFAKIFRRTFGLSPSAYRFHDK
ncbi:MAG: helix-turn-helix domain-containing protein [Lachnospiraceae bacterium]|nr:helix-turn-helix domain-containing protein [Lachnospiraceae bacterium]